MTMVEMAMFLLLGGLVTFLFFWSKNRFVALHNQLVKMDQRIDRRKMQITKLENRIKSLEERAQSENSNQSAVKHDSDGVSELIDDTTKLMLKAQPQNEDTGADLFVPVVEEKVVEILYAPNSNSRGEFRLDELGDRPIRNTFFKIDVLSTGDAANVTLYDGLAFDPGILSASDQYFGYVSTFENKRKETNSRLIVTKPGRLKKSEHGWIIQEKIKVRFE